MLPSGDDAETNDFNVPSMAYSEPVSRTLTEVEISGDEWPQPVKASTSDPESADSLKQSHEPGSTWREAEIQEIPQKYVSNAVVLMGPKSDLHLLNRLI